MKFKNSLFALLAGSLFFVSCSSDDDNGSGSGAYGNGTFVLNEGNSNPSSSSVSFIGSDGTVEQDIFKTVNPDAPAMGSYLQSMFFSNDYAFIISGLANKVTVVNRYTFEFVASIDTDFSNPRYGAVINGKAYITNSAAYADPDDFLTVIDLASFTTSTVELNDYAERVLTENDKLYIANGYYGSGSSVTVFNPANNTVEAVVELGYSPNSFDEQDGALYVMGGTEISRINLANNTISGTIELTDEMAGAKNLTISDNSIYYTVGTSVYTLPLNSTTVPTEALITYNSDSQWGAMYGFSAYNGKVYIADGGDFISNSDIYIYGTNGTLINTLKVGVGPNSFYFNN
ncbi:DUF5074 domain-containing protein [Flavobacterium rakeshii]|uniref:DUF5074 domain-containing protein n=1 Tax=Flavobacterium rakeshii TaxID=1038845 RepID=UPI002E7AC20A|nr:DUF5074 domain-containing protein [Flavobacterium rakeshii]MEE1899724.1 DUF5074 domain-containing protein [Flavobacterium rakeshii]